MQKLPLDVCYDGLFSDDGILIYKIGFVDRLLFRDIIFACVIRTYP